MNIVFSILVSTHDYLFKCIVSGSNNLPLWGKEKEGLNTLVLCASSISNSPSTFCNKSTLIFVCFLLLRYFLFVFNASYSVHLLFLNWFLCSCSLHLHAVSVIAFWSFIFLKSTCCSLTATYFFLLHCLSLPPIEEICSRALIFSISVILSSLYSWDHLLKRHYLSVHWLKKKKKKFFFSPYSRSFVLFPWNKLTLCIITTFKLASPCIFNKFLFV